MTGGSLGLGLALAREGAVLALVARDETELARAKSHLAEHKSGATRHNGKSWGISAVQEAGPLSLSVLNTRTWLNAGHTPFVRAPIRD
jgi:hypothetical protein